MQIEKLKANVRKNPVLSKLLSGPAKLLEGVRAPHAHVDRADYPGHWSPKKVE
jgi:ubiquinone biosynthesis protein COQ9